MSYHYDCSYPFLAIARKHGVPYGAVLAFAQFVDNSRKSYLCLPDLDQAEVMLAMPEEARAEIAGLCTQPVHERGGRHETVEIQVEDHAMAACRELRQFIDKYPHATFAFAGERSGLVDHTHLNEAGRLAELALRS